MPKSSISQSPIIPEREAEICARFREARLSLGIQQKDAARRVGLPLDTLRTYEYARVGLRFQVAWRFCQEFSISLKWLATGTGMSADFFKVSSDIARFIPGNVLLSSAYDSLVSRLPKTVILESHFGGVVEKYAMFGLSEERRERILRDSQIGWINAAIRGLPDFLVEEFSNEMRAASARFYEANSASITQNSRRENDVQKKTLKALSKNAVTVSQALGLEPNDVMDANRKFPPELLDFEFEPERGLLDEHLAEALQGIRQKYDGKKDESLTYSKKAGMEGVRYETPDLHTMQKTDISQRIKAARESLGLSQSEAAAQWKLRLQTLQQWEHGRREPRGLYRERIEKILSDIEGSSSTK